MPTPKYELNEAFQTYERLRMKKAKEIVDKSWRIGKIAHWKSSFSTKLRNWLLRQIPEFVNRKMNERIFELAEVGVNHYCKTTV